MRLRNKVVAITGAGRGIGLAAAELFAREGAKVAIVERDAASAAAVEQKLRAAGGTATAFPTDIAVATEVRRTFEAIQETFGALHVLYNNASIFLGQDDRPVDQLAEEVWTRILAVNLNGTYFCSKYALPLIIAAGGGAVIHTASSAGVIGIPNCDAYTATKGAVVALTRSMAVEYGPKKVRVNCIAPAAISTPMLRESSLDNAAFDEAAFFRTAPLGRYGTPDEIARVALFLASEEASYLNGAIIVADGGITVT